MTPRFRRRPSPALVISILALALAVSGGATAIAVSDLAQDKRIAKRISTRVFKKAIQGPLPSRATLRGRFAVAGHRVKGPPAGDLVDESAVSFQVPLPAKPSLHAIGVNGTPTAECPGSASDPKAAPGNLCLYESASKGNNGITVVNLGRFGFSVFATHVPADTDYELEGSWAVKAP
jgi:hypothetical protein